MSVKEAPARPHIEREKGPFAGRCIFQARSRGERGGGSNANNSDIKDDLIVQIRTRRARHPDASRVESRLGTNQCNNAAAMTKLHVE